MLPAEAEVALLLQASCPGMCCNISTTMLLQSRTVGVLQLRRSRAAYIIQFDSHD
jgi:hypothetical protein